MTKGQRILLWCAAVGLFVIWFAAWADVPGYRTLPTMVDTIYLFIGSIVAAYLAMRK